MTSVERRTESSTIAAIIATATTTAEAPPQPRPQLQQSPPTATILNAPIVNSKEVEWAVQLYHICREENVVTGCESLAFVNVPCTQQSADS